MGESYESSKSEDEYVPVRPKNTRAKKNLRKAVEIMAGYTSADGGTTSYRGRTRATARVRARNPVVRARPYFLKDASVRVREGPRAYDRIPRAHARARPRYDVGTRVPSQ